MSREPLETPDPRDPATYKVWESYPLRFKDQDLMQHVNNVVFSRLFESSRIEFWRGLGQFPFPKESGLIMVRGAIDYLRQLHYPDTVKIGTRIKQIGTSSLTSSFSAARKMAKRFCGSSSRALVTVPSALAV